MTDIKSISISISLIMYGYVNLFIEQTEKGLEVSSVAMADGGAVYFDEEKIFQNKNIKELSLLIEQVKLPEKEDESESKEWSFVSLDKEDTPINNMCLEGGYWTIDILKNIVNLIDKYLEETYITEYVHDIIDA